MPRHTRVLSSIRVGRVTFSFQRTLRIPDDGCVYPLPPGLGAFPIRRVRDFSRRVPAAWRERGGYFIPLYQREAMWISFNAPWWRPNAVTVGVGGVNALSGRRWTGRLTRRPQNYVVVPNQPWLDGINAGNGIIRQFVAMPLGEGYTVEGQLTGKETEGGIQLSVVEPMPGRFPSRSPRSTHRFSLYSANICCESSGAMGLAAGGRMTQKIYPDDHGIDTWDTGKARSAVVHMVDSTMYERITGDAPPPSPVSARTYTEYGFPWFALYDEDKEDIAPAAALAKVKSVTTMNADQNLLDETDSSPVSIGSGAGTGNRTG